MDKLLTQDEINDLLQAIESGDVDLDAEADEGSSSNRDLQRLDLFRGQTSARWRVANFDIILDAFARNSGISLANRLKRSVSVKRVSIETETFDNFLKDLQEQSLIGIVSFEPLRSGGLLIFDSPLAFCLLEVMFGGNSEAGISIPDRELTSIEINVLKNVMRDSCQDWENAFEPLDELKTNLVQAETNPRLVSIVSPETEVLISRFSVKAGNIFGQMSLVIPFFALEPYKEKLKNRMFDVITVSGGQAWTKTIYQEVLQMETEVRAQFATASLTIREILNLKVGDIIEIDVDDHAGQRVLVEQKPKFRAVAGTRKGKKAMRITRTSGKKGENDGRE
ncbi:MAG: flagellar motor switch protein FliM [Thermodesulfobacteriota bacterium]